jgi:hypothetical protein
VFFPQLSPGPQQQRQVDDRLWVGHHDPHPPPPALSTVSTSL